MVTDQKRVPHFYLVLYALAWSGGAIAYVPFLTILLPVQVEALAGAENSVSWLAYLSFSGAVSASLGAIIFGYLSDITHKRKIWILSGLVMSSMLLIFAGGAQSFPRILGILLVWQLGLNLMLAPLAAWAGDWVPDEQKGLLGGLMAFGPALGALSGAIVTWPDLIPTNSRSAAIAGIVCCCVLPLLLLVRMPEGPSRIDASDISAEKIPHLFDNPWVRKMWLARLAIQVAEAALFVYLYLWYRSINPNIDSNEIARIFGMVLVCAAPLALLVGSWSDQHNRPLLPLISSAIVSALGLGGMALSINQGQATAAYVVFGLGSSVFLALHSAQTLRFLPRSDRRGRDLGLFNLTNTVPSLAMPWLVLLLVPRFGYNVMFLLLSALALIAAIVIALMPKHA